MKKSLFLLASLLGLITTKINAQCPSGNTIKPSQNCTGAIPICQLSITYPTGYICGPGEIPGEIPTGSCLSSNEKNTTWFVFKISKAGKLKFLIKPLDVTGTSNGSTDYDWSVFKLPNGQTNTSSICNQLKNNLSWQFSCNYAGQSGPTGMYDTTGTVQLDVQGAGGSRFNQTKLVSIGEYYVLAVDNFSGGTLMGYNIKFADPNLDATIADITPADDSIALSSISKTPDCTNNNLVFNFSSPVRCDSVKASKFKIKGPNPPYTITSVYPVSTLGCSLNNQSQSYNLTFTPATSGYDYQLVLLDAVKDICGNIVTKDSMNFGITNDLSAVSISNTNGILSTSSITGATYQWFLNSVLIQGANMFYYTPTTTGIYSVVVTKGGCVQMANISFNASAINGKNNIADLVTVHPNPSKGVFQLKVTEKMNCVVTDVVGKIVWQKNNIETEELIDISQQANGVYLLKATTPTGSGTMKLVVQQ